MNILDLDSTFKAIFGNLWKNGQNMKNVSVEIKSHVDVMYGQVMKEKC